MKHSTSSGYFKKKINCLDVVKGVACLIVFFCHYYGAFIQKPLYKPVNGFLNGNLAVCIFLLISSFFLCEKLLIVDNCENIGKMCIKRYFRLVIPIFVSSFFALLLQDTIGFHNFEAGSVLNNFDRSKLIIRSLVSFKGI